jgi:iron complex outermembrane receptor protein
MRTRKVYNSRILLLVDGHRLNDSVYDQAFLGIKGLIDLDIIDRIEIIRGPGSSLYGNDTFFAVVNINNTRDGT